MEPDTERPEPERNRRTLVAVVLVVALVAVWVIWWQWDALTGNGSPNRPTAEEGSGGAGSAPPFGEGAEPAPSDVPSTVAKATRRWGELLDHPPVWPDDLSDPRSCEAAENDLARLCARLDERDYVQAASPEGGACALLRTAAEQLANDPPEISAELKSYPTMLDNVFHLYRALGRRQFELLARLQWEEQDLAEPVAMTLYRWVASREACARSGSTPLRMKALYDYSGFLFTTLGGQAYLRRRTPQVEALASFYALLILDRAVQAGYNPAGVDPRREIQRTRALIDEQPLVFHDRYLLVLDQMAERWKARSGSD